MIENTTSQAAIAAMERLATIVFADASAKSKAGWGGAASVIRESGERIVAQIHDLAAQSQRPIYVAMYQPTPHFPR